MLELFRRILADPDLLPTTPRLKEHADLKSLIEFILKKFFKTVKDNPLMLIEVRTCHRTPYADTGADLLSKEQEPAV